MLNIGERPSKYVKIWDNVATEEKYIKFKASSSRKDTRNEGQYVNSNWLVTFVGEARQQAESLQKGDLIEITNGGIETSYDKDKDKTYINVTVFGFKFEDGYGESQSQSSDKEDNVPPWMK